MRRRAPPRQRGAISRCAQSCCIQETLRPTQIHTDALVRHLVLPDLGFNVCADIAFCLSCTEWVCPSTSCSFQPYINLARKIDHGAKCFLRSEVCIERVRLAASDTGTSICCAGHVGAGRGTAAAAVGCGVDGRPQRAADRAQRAGGRPRYDLPGAPPPPSPSPLATPPPSTLRQLTDTPSEDGCTSHAAHHMRQGGCVVGAHSQLRDALAVARLALSSLISLVPRVPAIGLALLPQLHVKLPLAWHCFNFPLKTC